MVAAGVPFGHAGGTACKVIVPLSESRPVEDVPPLPFRLRRRHSSMTKMERQMDLARPRKPGPADPVPRTRSQEILAFVVLAILVWPVLTIGVVGGYGFTVWMYQQISGPPGPGRH